MTIKEFILSKILNIGPKAERDATAQLLGSPATAKRLHEAIATPAAPHLIFKDVEELKNALGI